MKSIQGKVVVITDGASPVGANLALECARYGARVVLLDRPESQAARLTTAEIHRNHSAATAHVYEVDLTCRQSIRTCIEAVLRDFRRIDVLVNNVDLLLAGSYFVEMRSTDTEQTMGVNAFSTIWATQAVLPLMLQAKSGHLVHFGTMAGALGAPRLTDYCTSKYAVMGFHEALRQELRKSGKTAINLTLVCPTLIDHQAQCAASKGWTRSIQWIEPDRAATLIVRAIRNDVPQLVLPRDIGMIAGFLSVLPTGLATWARRKLGLSTVMDNVTATAVHATTEEVHV